LRSNSEKSLQGPSDLDPVVASEKATDMVPPEAAKADKNDGTGDIATTPPIAVPSETSPPGEATSPNASEASAVIVPDLRENSFEKMLPDKKPDASEANAKNPTDPENSTLDSSEMSEAMKRFSQIFSPGSLTLLPDAIAKDEPTSGSEAGLEKVDIETLYHPPPVIEPSRDAIQSTMIHRMATKAPIPLGVLLVGLGQLSGGGLSWDIDSIRMSEFDIDRPVSLSVESTTLGELLNSLCGENGLVPPSDEQGPIRLRPLPEEIEKRLPTDWAIQDLVSQEASIAQWQDLLQQIYPDWSTEWKIQGQELQWAETASPLRRATIAAFLDQVRRAHGLALKSSLPNAVTDPRLGIDEAVLRLSRAGTRVIEHPISLPQLLDTAARDSGMKLVFDWESLFSHGFSHSKAATSLIRGRTWPEISKWGLDEFSLVAAIDGDSHIVLTTLPRQRRMWRTMILKLESGKTIESVRESLRMLSPTNEQGLAMLLVSPIPQVGGTKESWVVARICPPNTVQLQTRVLREALRLPALMKNPL
jgi:hypothetical protein